MSMVAAGIAAGAGVLVGGGQMIFSGKGRQQRELDKIANNSPMQMGNKAINDYYQRQMDRANANPYQSASYINSMSNINSNAANAMNSLQSRRSAIGGVGRINAMSNQAAGNAVGQAINQSNQANAAYGQATSMKAADDRSVWQNNVLDPYQRKLQLQQMRTKAANDRFDNGMKMIGSSINNFSGVAAASAGGYGGVNRKTFTGDNSENY